MWEGFAARVSFVSKCLLAESAPKERSRFAHGSDSKLVQNGPHGPKALTVRSRFDIQNWSKMVLMGQKRSRFAHGDVQNDYRGTFALKMVVSRKIMVSQKSRSRSAHANFAKWGPFFAKWWFRGKSRSRSLTQWGPFFAKWSKRLVWRKTPAHAPLRSRNDI